MTWRDKLEVGLKEDAPFRKDNLPESQVRGPEIPSGPGRSPVIPMARGDRNEVLDGEPVTETEADEPADDTSEAEANTDGMAPAGKP